MDTDPNHSIATHNGGTEPISTHQGGIRERVHRLRAGSYLLSLVFTQWRVSDCLRELFQIGVVYRLARVSPLPQPTRVVNHELPVTALHNE